ncbi:MAG: hypothetical protein RL417_226, partial [Pseudomonadota bacterium]
MTQEKSHPPSRRRREKALREGKVLRSQILTRVGLLGGVFGLGVLGAQFCWVRWSLLLKWQLTEGFTEPLASCREVVLSGFLLSALLLGLGAGVALLIDGLQTGVPLGVRPVLFRLDRLEPFAGLGRVISGLRGLWFQGANIGLAALLFYGFFPHAVTTLAGLDPFDRIETVSATMRLAARFLWGGFTGIACVSGIDFFIQRRRFLKELSMSLDEVKREHREEEGDPLMRSIRLA